LTATAASVSQINLSWSVVSGATSYKIYRSTDSYTTAIATTSGVSYSDTGLSTATSYSYKVSAVNAEGEGEKSSVASATTNSASSGGGGGGGYSDTTPPTNTSVVINSNATTTNSLAVTLTLGATDAVYMMIANDSSFTNATWVNYATSYVWNLTSGGGTKTVYVKFKDGSGNVSAAISDTILLAGSDTATSTTGTVLVSPTLKSGFVFKVKIKFGDKGEEVRQLQIVLKELGYLKNAKANAIFNAVTRKALLAYQRANKIKATGILDDATRLKLNGKKVEAVVAPVTTPKTVTKFKFTQFLNTGANSNEVLKLQEILKELGYFSANPTGYFGPATKAAVIKFQTDRKISNAPGWVGPATREVLNSL